MHGRYLADTSEVPVHALGRDTSYRQWKHDLHDRLHEPLRTAHHRGCGLQDAVAERHFTLIVLDRGNPAGWSKTVRDALVHSTDHSLIGAVPYATAGGSSRFELWAPQSNR
ncbi:hypothetical protein ACFY1U_40625 [Streptomyces sp. NPDC001351]|uniref:hypothetical protein n=1 Tax=Streptomyces sp. NPDC001351 TaxID=3364564 RepID=UPI00368A76D8